MRQSVDANLSELASDATTLPPGVEPPLPISRDANSVAVPNANPAPRAAKPAARSTREDGTARPSCKRGRGSELANYEGEEEEGVIVSFSSGCSACNKYGFGIWLDSISLSFSSFSSSFSNFFLNCDSYGFGPDRSCSTAIGEDLFFQASCDTAVAAVCLVALRVLLCSACFALLAL